MFSGGSFEGLKGPVMMEEAYGRFPFVFWGFGLREVLHQWDETTEWSNDLEKV